jgi:ribulose-5-phosphate 4-epimerase/fuculose-1-phosphate aldolase
MLPDWGAGADEPMQGWMGRTIGQTLEEAFQWASCLEESCQVILAAKTIDEPLLEYRKLSEDYKSW